MRPVTISLDSQTWELSKKKTNFSAWVRDKLRSERNNKVLVVNRYCTECEMVRRTQYNFCTLCMKPFNVDE